MTDRVQTLVQLTDELVAALDRRAARRGMSRSALIRELIVAGLGDESGRTVSQRIIDGYERVPQQTASDAWGDLDRWSEVNARRNLAALVAEEDDGW